MVQIVSPGVSPPGWRFRPPPSDRSEPLRRPGGTGIVLPEDAERVAIGKCRVP